MDRRTVLSGLIAAGGLSATPFPAKTQATTQASKPVMGQWTFTTQDRPWQAGPIAQWGKFNPSINPSATINTAKAYQAMEGFGACFSELGWDALSLLSATDRAAVFNELYGDSGAGFTAGRLPVGASDFARSWYSYDETPGDFELSKFSIERDETGLMPFIRAAKSVRKDLKLWASPWSPPSWMKKNGHYALTANYPGRPPNGLKQGQSGREGTDTFILEDRYLETYAGSVKPNAPPVIESG
jgi:glucosylceramidase